MQKFVWLVQFDLADYNYAWIYGNVEFYSYNGFDGALEIGCEVYRFFDRIVSVVSNSEYAFMAEGASRFVIVNDAISARKKSDYYVTMSGQVQVRTATTYTAQSALNIGLPQLGFSVGGGGGFQEYYYKTVRINQDIY